MSLKERDRSVIWHPFNQMKGSDVLPIVSAKGVYLIDEEGNKYIDAFSSWWVNLHGHSHPYLNNALSEQAKVMEHVAFGGFTHEPAVKLAEKVLEVMPQDFTKVFFSDNGSTSTEVALKLTMQYHYNLDQKKDVFIALENGYHGDTFGSMCVTARGGFNEPFEKHMFDVRYIPAPTKENRVEVLRLFNEIVAEGNVAGFIFEPLVQGAGGMLLNDADVLSELIKICKINDVVSIADEVMTGFGRTGKMFAIDHLSVKPDISCLSKGVTGGYLPIGLTVVNEKIYEAFYSDEPKHTFLHGHSYTGNTLACALGVANFELFEKEETLKKVEELTENLKEVKGFFEDHPKVRALRHLGCILAIELETEGVTSYFNVKGKEAYKHFLKRGIVLRPLGNVLILIPPYCINRDELLFIKDEIMNYLSI